MPHFYRFYTNQELAKACPQPCYQRGQQFRMDYVHKNLYISHEEANTSTTFYFGILWETLLVEEEVEALVYDGINFVAAAGGNLGLLLGFSCFGLLQKLITYLKNWLKS